MVKFVAMSQMGVLTRLLVMASFGMLGCFTMMLGCFVEMPGCFVVMMMNFVLVAHG